MNSTSTSTSTSGSGSGSKRRKREIKTGKGGLAMGYEVMEIRDDADEGIYTHHYGSSGERKGRKADL